MMVNGVIPNRTTLGRSFLRNEASLMPSVAAPHGKILKLFGMWPVKKTMKC